jgi:hypothetical protein
MIRCLRREEDRQYARRKCEPHEVYRVHDRELSAQRLQRPTPPSTKATSVERELIVQRNAVGSNSEGANEVFVRVVYPVRGGVNSPTSAFSPGRSKMAASRAARADAQSWEAQALSFASRCFGP